MKGLGFDTFFADDTNIFFSHNGPNQLMEIVNNELKKLSSWFPANTLSINLKNSVFFHLKQNKFYRQKLELQFSVNGIEIDRVNEVLFCRSWKLYLMNTYLGNLKYKHKKNLKYKQEKSQNQKALFTNQVSALIRLPYVLSNIKIWPGLKAKLWLILRVN